MPFQSHHHVNNATQHHRGVVVGAVSVEEEMEDKSREEDSILINEGTLEVKNVTLTNWKKIEYHSFLFYHHQFL